MTDHIIPDDNGRGVTIASIGSDIEFVDPIKHYADRTIKTCTLHYETYLTAKNPTFPPEFIKKNSVKYANEFWEKQLQKIISTEIPPKLLTLLKTPKKRAQINLLKGVTVNPEQLHAFIFKAHSEFGYTYSCYTSHHYPSDIDVSALPKLATLDRKTGAITKVGHTTLTDGQIKHAIEDRKVVVTKFIDNGSDWHAFFITFKSIGGQESWRNGQAHYHYISDKFGIPREEAVKQFKSNKYPTTSVHIPLLDYG
jgi:hypothetical protein